MDIFYDLELQGTESEYGVPLFRVIAYARNRVMANMFDSLIELPFLNDNLSAILLEIGVDVVEVEVDIEEELKNILEDDELLYRQLRRKLYRVVDREYLSIMSIESASEVIRAFGEEVSISHKHLSFEFGKEYSYSAIDNTIITINNGIGEDSYDEVFSMVELGNEIVGEFFVVLKRFSNDDVVASFVLTGASGSGYILKCIYAE
jgi:hypothetical protein